MMRSLFAGVSGLKTHQTRMDVIGNNIANVNTVGYKGSRVTFQDVLSQTIRNATAPATSGKIGGVNAQQVGLGVSLGTIDVNHAQGNIQLTGIATDLALEGDGYFVVTDGAKQYYTRAGVFGLDKQGYLVNRTNGMYVAGWMADGSGDIDPTGKTEALKIPLDATIPARATNKVELGGNLDAESNGKLKLSSADFTVTDSSGTNSVKFSVALKPTGAFNEYEVVITPDGDQQPVFTTTVEVAYDGSGWVLRPKTGEGKDFTYTIGGTEVNVSIGEASFDTPLDEGVSADLEGLFTTASDGTDTWEVNSAMMATYTPATVKHTTEVYDSLGGTHTVTTTFTKLSDNEWAWSATAPDELVAGGSLGNGTLRFDSSGRNPVVQGNTSPIDLDFSKVTQYSDETSVFLVNQDGYPSGVLEGFSIDANGVLTGEFSNGLTRALGQIAVARFGNDEGLLRAGENLFAASNNSGEVNIGTAGSGGRGSITPGAVEMSNVDLSQEFTEMIITQRGFQANSRIITASDEMLQELVNLKR